MKSRCCFVILILSFTQNGAMNKTGKKDAFYSSLIQLIHAREYDKAYRLFNARTKKEILYPDQIPALSTALHNSELLQANPYFYTYLTALISIYSDALNGRLLINEYMDALYQKQKRS